MRIDDEAEAAGRAKPVRRAKPVLDPDPTDLGEWSGRTDRIRAAILDGPAFSTPTAKAALHADHVGWMTSSARSS